MTTYELTFFRKSSIETTPVVGDVTIRSPYSTTQRCPSADALKKAETDKCRKYKNLCNQMSYGFEVYAMDHFGKLSKDVHELLKKVQFADGTLCAINRFDKVDWTTANCKVYWRRRLSCTLQRNLAIKELWTAQQMLKLYGNQYATFFGGNWHRSNWDQSSFPSMNRHLRLGQQQTPLNVVDVTSMNVPNDDAVNASFDEPEAPQSPVIEFNLHNDFDANVDTASSFRVVPSDNSLGSEELMSDPFGLRSLRTRVVHVPEYNFRVSPTRDVDVVVNVEVDSMSP